MGIDNHGLNFLKYGAYLQPLGRVVTIGRQQVDLSTNEIKRILGIDIINFKNDFCEDMLLTFFKAVSVTSLDASKYEEASVVHDLNLPIPDKLKNKFDCILDFGTTEHIYNLHQAFKNYSEMLTKDGVILHVLPANNFNGHGFYQFSTELFYSLYSPKNGYEETVVFLADLADNEVWYKPPQPSNAKRVLFKSNTETYILVRTKLTKEKFNHDDVQQSDYVKVWSDGRDSKPVFKNKSNWIYRLKSLVKKIPIFYTVFKYIKYIYVYKSYSLNCFSKIKIIDFYNKSE